MVPTANNKSGLELCFTSRGPTSSHLIKATVICIYYVPGHCKLERMWDHNTTRLRRESICFAIWRSANWYQKAYFDRLEHKVELECSLKQCSKQAAFPLLFLFPALVATYKTTPKQLSSWEAIFPCVFT